MIYAYTRLLSPAAFGSYSYVFSAVLVLQTSLFYALPIAVMRFFPGARLAGRRDGLLKEAYLIFYAMSIVLAALCVCVGLLVDLPDAVSPVAWLALPMLLFRSLVQLNQSVNRSSNLMGRFNTIECLHAVLGFGLGLAALYLARSRTGGDHLGIADCRRHLLAARRQVAGLAVPPNQPACWTRRNWCAWSNTRGRWLRSRRPG